jgi:hypothetical protein
MNPELIVKFIFKFILSVVACMCIHHIMFLPS